MTSVNRVTFFACGNGDCTLLESGTTKIITDINYRQAAKDEDEDDVPDFAPEIREACVGDVLDVFVLTHPDEDHCRGIGEIFFLGDPKDWDDDPDEGEAKILIKEIWCSPYAITPHYETDDSVPILKEIKRRNNLKSGPKQYQDGNKLQVMSTDTHRSGEVGPFSWELISPTKDEATIPAPKKGEDPSSSNPSSLGIVWELKTDGYDNRIMLLGDATVEVLERINATETQETREWSVLLAPHHCSRRSIGRVEDEGTDEEEYVTSEEAEAALFNQKDDGHIVSSSRGLEKNGESPPSWDAKQRYLRILSRGEDPGENEEKRFHCTGGEGKDAEPKKVVFDFTRNGPVPGKEIKKRIAIASAVGSGGSYG